VFLEPLGYNFFINIYRRLTPQMRTPDEHPLKDEDFKLIRESFPANEFQFFNFLSLFCVPFPRLQDSAARLDRLLLQSPLTYRLAWNVVMTLRRT